MKKQFILSILVIVSICIGCIIYAAQWCYSPAILMYHNITEDIKGSMYVSPTSFQTQMSFLKKHNYNVIHLNELVNALRNKTVLPKRTVVITFDDGYEDNFTHALPILAKYDFPAHIFLITDYLGKVEDGEMHLTWDHVAIMAKNNITFGPHTHTNKYLPDLPINEATQEILTSRNTVAKRIGISPRIFSFPIGGFTPELQQILKKNDFIAAVTTNRGTSRLQNDLFALKRIKMKDSYTSPLKLAALYSGYYHLLKNPKASH